MLLNRVCAAFVQSVLDSTYHHECQLVEGGFPNDIARNVISTILGCLSVYIARNMAEVSCVCVCVCVCRQLLQSSISLWTD